MLTTSVRASTEMAAAVSVSGRPASAAMVGSVEPSPNTAIASATVDADAGKRAKRIAIVALARKLIVALWRYLTTGLVPAGATMKA